MWIAPTIIVVVIIVLDLVAAQQEHAIAVRIEVDPIKFKLPVFGPLIKKIAVARFTRNLANMLGAGVPILQALLDRR